MLLAAVCRTVVFAQAIDRQVIRDSIYSNILKEERILLIALPDGYSSATGPKTSVIYVTDGQWNAVGTANITNFLQSQQFIPPHIIVGIDDSPKGKGNMRYRDLTPTRNPSDKTPTADGGSGGAPAFLDFITKELMPYINQKYANNGKNTLFGHSLGGLFGMYALLQQPQAFDGYILADPSLWWNNYELQKMAREKLAKLAGGPKCLFITGRSGAPYKGMGVTGIDSVLNEHAPGNLQWKSAAYDDEVHNSMAFRTMYDGLKFVYWGYYSSNNLWFGPGSGFLLKDQPATVHWMNDNFSDIYYTTDGTTPTRASAPVKADTIRVNAGTKLKLRAICNQEDLSRTISGNFRLSDVFPAVPLPKSAKPGGLRYDYYLLKDTNNLAKAKPVKSGIADSAFQLGQLPNPEKYICVISGFINFPESGYYFIGNNSWGASKLYIGKQLIIDQPDADQPNVQSCVVPVSKGFYPIRIEHILRQGEKKLELYYIAPKGVEHGGNPELIPWKVMYGKM